MTTHLTLTGYYAGLTLCDNHPDPQDKYVHAMYAPLDNPAFAAQVCPDCQAVWDDADSDEQPS